MVFACSLGSGQSSFRQGEVNTAMAAQFSQSPAPSVRERAADIQAAHATLLKSKAPGARLHVAAQALPLLYNIYIYIYIDYYNNMMFSSSE